MLSEFSSLLSAVILSMEGDNESGQTVKKRYRRAVANPNEWKSRKITLAYHQGKPYVNRRGKCVPAKSIKTLKNCLHYCKFKCSTKISDDERLQLFNVYYSLSNATEKRHFLINNTTRALTKRPKRKNFNNEAHNDSNSDSQSAEESSLASLHKNQSRRTYSFTYFFHVKGEKVQVCKNFFLGTLSISQKPVYTAHITKNLNTNIATKDKRRKSASRKVPEKSIDFERTHINYFPKVESHYCMATTAREYLEQILE